MYIGYDIKNGVKYAKICKSYREGGKVKTKQVSLGRVIDEKAGIYRNRKRGVFTYDLKTDTYGEPPSDAEIPVIQRKNAQEKLILDFGSTHFLDRYIVQSGLLRAIHAMHYGNKDSLFALLQYYIQCNMANYNAAEWLEGSYARILYPKANLESQRISNILASIGQEASYRDFFREYMKLLKHRDGEDILIDSTGLPNSIHFPLTAVSCHNGQISNEVRLIYVVQQGTNLPLYFRYVAGNIIDVSTLTKTILELKAQNINTRFAILDAGYLTKENTEELLRNKISFVTRMRENSSLYQKLVEEHLPTLCSEENLVSYNSRYIYLKRIECELLPGHKGYAYLGMDLAMRSMEASKLFENAGSMKLTEAQVHQQLRRKGVFVLVATRPVAKEKILPLYYTRQQIEQVFDISKNNTNLLPLRVHDEDTFRGHLLLSFVAAIICKQLQDDLKETPFTPEIALLALRNHKCKVFESEVITMEATKKANTLYKKFRIKVEHTYPIQRCKCS